MYVEKNNWCVFCYVYVIWFGCVCNKSSTTSRSSYLS